MTVLSWPQFVEIAIKCRFHVREGCSEACIYDLGPDKLA